MYEGIGGIIAKELMRLADKSGEKPIAVYPEILIDSINYDICESYSINVIRKRGEYHHSINFMGFNFVTTTRKKLSDL